MKNNKKTLKNILCILILIILFLIIQSTYSKYIEKEDKKTETPSEEVMYLKEITELLKKNKE